MKTILISILNFLISATYGQVAKPNYFKLTDTSFCVNDIHVMEYAFPKWTCFAGQTDTTFAKIADSLIAFLKKYRTVKIEIGVHTDSIGKVGYNDTLSYLGAGKIVNYLESVGMSKHRIKPFGYGGKVPRYVTSDIAKKYPFLTTGTFLDKKTIDALETDKKKEIAQSLNKRVEIKIVE